MNATRFINLSSSEKKKIVKSAVRGANEDQKKLVEEYRRRETSGRCLRCGK